MSMDQAPSEEKDFKPAVDVNEIQETPKFTIYMSGEVDGAYDADSQMMVKYLNDGGEADPELGYAADMKISAFGEDVVGADRLAATQDEFRKEFASVGKYLAERYERPEDMPEDMKARLAKLRKAVSETPNYEEQN